MQTYHHISPEERAAIMLELKRGSSMRSIGRLLHRPTSTVSRELNRDRNTRSFPYFVTTSRLRYQLNRKRCVRDQNLILGTPLYGKVQSWLINQQWSRTQISGRLKHLYSHQPDMEVSPETIYASIYSHLKKLMIQGLRSGKNKRGPRGNPTSNYNSVKVEEYQLIGNRPEEINERLLPGQWEGDLIAGPKNQSCIGTLVDRKIGYVLLSKIKKPAFEVRTGFETQMKDLPDILRLSMTYDRGSEMAQRPIMSQTLNMKIYFADPHVPWQSGSK
ncbi:MAG: IS30 family transposase [Arenicella sp.]|jgi:IS30 family transposase